MRKIARTIQKNLGKLALAAGAAVASVQTQAALDTNVTGMASELSSFFNGDIKPLVIAVVGFGILIGYVKLLRRK